MSTVSIAPSTCAQAPAGPPRIVTGAYLAKAGAAYSPHRRAADAVRWCRGEVRVEPTLKLAADVFNVSPDRVRKARARIEGREIAPRGKGNGSSSNGATAFTDTALDMLISKIGVEPVRRAIERLERLASPELPFAVATGGNAEHAPIG